MNDTGATQNVMVINGDEWMNMAKSIPNAVLEVSTYGISMWPLLRANKDAIRVFYLDRPPVRGDIVLFLRADGKEIAHRVRQVDGDVVQTMGDNCIAPDAKISVSHIRGVVKFVRRRGRWFSVDNGFWRLYGKFMLWSNPVRMFIREKIYHPVRRNISRLIKGKKS